MAHALCALRSARGRLLDAHTRLILGAWGCGVFRNRPEVVAELWSEVLDTLEWRGRFARVVFAVPRGAHGHSLAAFRRARAPAAGPLIPLYLLVRCFYPGCVRVASTWPCVHGVGP